VARCTVDGRRAIGGEEGELTKLTVDQRRRWLDLCVEPCERHGGASRPNVDVAALLARSTLRPMMMSASRAAAVSLQATTLYRATAHGVVKTTSST
jgi:hypothetical protein